MADKAVLQRFQKESDLLLILLTSPFSHRQRTTTVVVVIAEGRGDRQHVVATAELLASLVAAVREVFGVARSRQGKSTGLNHMHTHVNKGMIKICTYQIFNLKKMYSNFRSQRRRHYKLDIAISHEEKRGVAAMTTMRVATKQHRALYTSVLLFFSLCCCLRFVVLFIQTRNYIGVPAQPIISMN